jgi:hypothetical protein
MKPSVIKGFTIFKSHITCHMPIELESYSIQYGLKNDTKVKMLANKIAHDAARYWFDV